jgi:hypothetical protein
MVAVEGYVVDNNGNPVENATVTIPTQGLFALSDDNGYFVMNGVSPGIHTVYAIQRFYEKFGADVNISEDTVITITLDKQV